MVQYRHIFTDDYFKYDTLAVDKAGEADDRFGHLHNVKGGHQGQCIWRLNLYDKSDNRKGQKSPLESSIQSYQVFNNIEGCNGELTACGEEVKH